MNHSLPIAKPSAQGVRASSALYRDAARFKALGDPVRLRLLELICSADETCVCDLTPHFTQSGPTISHHLRILREAGLIDSERRGTWVYYRFEDDAAAELAETLRGLRR